MVLYYTLPDTNHLVYMGKDKYENEVLIENALPIDVWFHVDDFSSAHVYLRLFENETVESLNKSVIEACSHFVKHNSIEGSKKSVVNVIYTLASNLKKTENMDTGTVGFINNSKTYKVKNIQKNKELVKKILKTEVEKTPDLAAEKSQYLRAQIQLEKNKKKEEINKKKEEEKLKEIEKAKIQNDIDAFNNLDNYKTNADYDEEDDFL